MIPKRECDNQPQRVTKGEMEPGRCHSTPERVNKKRRSYPWLGQNAQLSPFAEHLRINKPKTRKYNTSLMMARNNSSGTLLQLFAAKTTLQMLNQTLHHHLGSISRQGVTKNYSVLMKCTTNLIASFVKRVLSTN